MNDKEITVESGDNSNNNVAARDVIINGMSYTEVKDLFFTLFDSNFPKLVEVAKQEAINNVADFLDNYLRKKLEENPNIDIARFSKPDVQFSLNEAVIASAQKGQSIDLNILSDMVVNRLSQPIGDIVDFASAEAINVIKKLNSQQIAFLAFCHCCFYVQYKIPMEEQLPTQMQIQMLDLSFYKSVADHFMTAGSISMSNILYLQSLGLLSFLSFYEYNFMDILKKQHNWTQIADINQLISLYAVHINDINNVYKKGFAHNVSLTPIGQVIAIAAMNAKFSQKVDYKIWIN
jgi:hypothetical protein